MEEDHSMEDNKKDYNDFFKNDDQKEAEPKQEKPSYYYSYGPYKSSDTEERKPETTSVVSSADVTEVEMTSPQPLRSMDSFNDPIAQSSERPGWTAKEPYKRSSGKTFFAGFMAATLVVGSLMFVSDKMNLFTGDKVLVNIGSSASASAAGANNGAVKTAAVDLARPTNIAQIAQNSSPAVVKIETLVRQKSQQSSSGGGSVFDDPFFRQFFGDQTPNQTQPQTKQNSNSTKISPLVPQGLGSGFIFEKTGYILTNEHVIDGADEIQVTVQGYDKPFTAKLLGNSYDLDLAVLKIEGSKDFPMLPLGNVDSTNVGDWVVAIGNPYGFDHTVTVGVLSAKERPIEIPDQQGTRKYKHLLQTDASINPGNSGGPLINLNGDVIGINTAVSSQAQGIGFAIPTSTIQGVLTSLINNVTIPKEPAPYIGANVGNIDDTLVQDLQLSNTDGALVAGVPIGGPAFKAGLKTNDVIVGFNGTAIKTNQELIDLIQKSKVGDKVTLNIIRDGKKMDVIVTIGDKNTDKSAQQN
jgi:serine protease Do